MKIVDDIPPPTESRNRWPFDTMEVKQCMVLDNDKDFRNAVRAAGMYGRRVGRVYMSRKNRGEPGGKIWRME